MIGTVLGAAIALVSAVISAGLTLVGAENPVTSCDLPVHVYETAESISSQWSECSSGPWGSGACGRLLM